MQILHHGKYYDFEHDPEKNVLVFRWKDTTKDMDDQDFRDALSNYAGFVLEYQIPFCMVDLRAFAFQPGKETAVDWRLEYVNPRYNKAGTRKFGYVLPEGKADEDSRRPKRQSEGDEFLTSYMDNENDVLQWFKES